MRINHIRNAKKLSYEFSGSESKNFDLISSKLQNFSRKNTKSLKYLLKKFKPYDILVTYQYGYSERYLKKLAKKYPDDKFTSYYYPATTWSLIRIGKTRKLNEKTLLTAISEDIQTSYADYIRRHSITSPHPHPLRKIHIKMITR